MQQLNSQINTLYIVKNSVLEFKLKSRVTISMQILLFYSQKKKLLSCVSYILDKWLRMKLKCVHYNILFFWNLQQVYNPEHLTVVSLMQLLRVMQQNSYG
jgi:hypothetical protein